MTISEQIVTSIYNDNVANALELIKQRSNVFNNWDIQSELEKIEFSYYSMLDFMLQNYVDDNAINLRNTTKEAILNINETLNRLERQKNTPAELYCSTISQYKNEVINDEFLAQYENTIACLNQFISFSGIEEEKRNQTIDDLKEKIEKYRVQLFNLTWTSSQWKVSDYAIANKVVGSAQLTESDKALFVSAVALSIMEYFDTQKILFLLDVCLSESNEISSRAIVGIIVVVRRYTERLNLSKDINNKIKILSDDKRFVQNVIFACIQLQLCCATETITIKMNNDILPSIMAGSHFKETMNGISIVDNDNTDTDENPKWEEFKVNEIAEKKIREMADLQTDGVDVYYSTFKIMKSDRFFNTLPHWFYMFDSRSPFIYKSNENINDNSASQIIQLAPFCNSDLYSFALSLKQINQLFQGQDLSSIIGDSLSEEKMEAIKKLEKDDKRAFVRICRSYIFDLYRFYHLHPVRNQFFNPFRQNITGRNGEYSFLPMDIDALKYINIDDKDLIVYGDILMRSGLYSYALNIYKNIHVEDSNIVANLFEKTGYCLEKLGKDADDYYMKAYTITPNSIWLLKHLIAVLVKKEEYAKCIVFCDELLAMDSENTKCLYHASLCHYKIGHFAIALEYAYKLDYLVPNFDGIRDIIIACLLGTKNTDKLCDYIMGTDNLSDILISGFLFVYEKNYIGAHELFKMAWEVWVKDVTQEKTSFSENFYSAYNLFNSHIELDKNIVSMLYDATILR